ncbi:RNA degradosome polyphosphate kinase [Aquipuribacter sp. MA13-6]|uniref:RNA degradosome polyphosphate kinase n=1 Tax=unclassified Aquipuribacter TaxID=2635084 RepID=UPI003EE9B49B
MATARRPARTPSPATKRAPAAKRAPAKKTSAKKVAVEKVPVDKVPVEEVPVETAATGHPAATGLTSGEPVLATQVDPGAEPSSTARARRAPARRATDVPATDPRGGDDLAEHLGAPSPPHAEEPDDLPEDRFADREVSWLAFNERVLELAEDPDMPLLERARFLAIFASNLDEFHMVRVAGLKRRIATGIAVRAASGLEPREILHEISQRTDTLMARHARVYRDDIAPAMASQGITVLRWDQLDDHACSRLTELFRAQVFPVLTPLAVDPAHPFPYISGLSLNLAVVVSNPATGKQHFARVKVPPVLPRFLRVPHELGEDDDRADFVPLEDVIAAHLGMLFPGMDVVRHSTFRVTRNEDLEVEEDDAENLLQALEKELLRRRFGPPVRLELADDIAEEDAELLLRELGVTPDEVYRLPEPLDLRGLFIMADVDRPELQFPTFLPRTHRDLAEVESAKASDVFAAVSRRDVLLHHPYDSFSTSVQAFLEQAAADPDVLAIKQTLYRTSGDSPIVDALIDAADSGKQVLALVEIKARFDEQANISWARKLEQAGVHVVYGIVGLKTHCKLSLVVRREPGGLARYCHVGTGNYNPKTARLYEDLGLLTKDPQVADDLAVLFNQLSGFAPSSSYRRLLVAPRTVRQGLVDLVEREISNHEKGLPAGIRLKLNSIVDEAFIDSLYRASQAGVDVDLVVRGICAVRPGVPGLSDNIRVRSILGRFLEHSRIFAFVGGGDPVVYIGSADMMHRNLDRRVEALVRLGDRRHVDQLMTLLDTSMDPGTASWHLQPDGQWVRHHLDDEGRPLADLQTIMIAAHGGRSSARRGARRPSPGVRSR